MPFYSFDNVFELQAAVWAQCPGLRGKVEMFETGMPNGYRINGRLVQLRYIGFDHKPNWYVNFESYSNSPLNAGGDTSVV